MIISFCKVENHKGDKLGKAIEVCLIDCGRPKILAMTLDNVSTNNGIFFLKKKAKLMKDTILKYEFLHICCCTHILNLIVHKWFKEYDNSIANVRNVIEYVMSSLQRWSAFKACIQLE